MFHVFVVKMSYLCLYMRVCVELCVKCLLSKPRAPRSQNHMLVKSNWGEILKGREGKRGAGAQLNGEQDGTNGEIYNNGR